MKTSQELIEQAFALYRRLLEVEGLSGFFSNRAQRLRLLADKANARYQRRLQASLSKHNVGKYSWCR